MQYFGALILAVLYVVVMLANMAIVRVQRARPHEHHSLIGFVPGICLLLIWLVLARELSWWMLLIIPVFDPLVISLCARWATPANDRDDRAPPKRG